MLKAILSMTIFNDLDKLNDYIILNTTTSMKVLIALLVFDTELFLFEKSLLVASNRVQEPILKAIPRLFHIFVLNGMTKALKQSIIVLITVTSRQEMSCCCRVRLLTYCRIFGSSKK